VSLFQKRHYEWLAAFARAELPTGDRIALRNALAREGSRFNADKFDRVSGVAEYLAGVAAVKRSATPTSYTGQDKRARARSAVLARLT